MRHIRIQCIIILGTEVFANQVLSYIVTELDIAQTVSYKEDIYMDKPIVI